MSDNPISRLEGHRFGEAGGADPATATLEGNPKWSIRHAIRHIGTLTRAELQTLAQDPDLTMAQLVAVKKYLSATSNRPNIKAMDKLEDSVDGKLVEKKVEVRTDSYAALMKEAEELAKAKYDDPSKK